MSRGIQPVCGISGASSADGFSRCGLHAGCDSASLPFAPIYIYIYVLLTLSSRMKSQAMSANMNLGSSLVPADESWINRVEAFVDLRKYRSMDKFEGTIDVGCNKSSEISSGDGPSSNVWLSMV